MPCLVHNALRALRRGPATPTPPLRCLPHAMQRLLQLIYLMLPVYAANMAPPFVRYWPGRARPISER
jgi:hypothetical protein